MNWTASLPPSVQRDIRDAGRGHLLGDYRSPLDQADEARKRSKEEPQMTNTDTTAAQAGGNQNEAGLGSPKQAALREETAETTTQESEEAEVSDDEDETDTDVDPADD
jgi:hypothetical protein